MKNLTSPEAILMLCVAGLLDIISTTSAILILVFGIGIVVNYIVWIVSIIIMGTWLFIRWLANRVAGGQAERQENPMAQKDELKEEVGGSGDSKDWEKNKDGVYQLNKKDGAKGGTAPQKSATPNKNAGKGATGGLKDVKDIAQDVAKGDIGGAAKKGGWKAIKWLLNYLIEAVPVVGSFWPANIIFVLMNL